MFDNIKLREKIFLCFCLLVLLDSAVLFALDYLTLETYTKETAYHNLELSAIRNRDFLEAFMSRGHNDVELIMTNPIIRSDKFSAEEKSDVLKMIQNTYKTYDDISIIDLNGRIVASTTYAYSNYWSKNEWYRQAMDGSIVISRPHITSDSADKVVIVFMGPLRDDDGKVISIVSIRMPMEQVWAITDQAKIGERGYLLVVDEYDRLVAYPDKEMILEKLPGGPKLDLSGGASGRLAYRLSGAEMLGAYSSFSENAFGNETIRWKIMAVQPLEEVMSALRIRINNFIMVSALSMIFILLVGFVLYRSITGPLGDLMRGVTEMKRGNLGYRVRAKGGDELGQLAAAFNQMAEDLTLSMANMEKTVSERTTQLNGKVIELENFNRLMVDRELRMIELKKRVSELEGELEKHEHH